MLNNARLMWESIREWGKLGNNRDIGTGKAEGHVLSQHFEELFKL